MRKEKVQEENKDDAVFFVVRLHLKNARDAVRSGANEKATKEYRHCIRILKSHNHNADDILSEYEDFVKRDPIYKSLATVFVAGLKENPGITELVMNTSDITKDWGIRFGLGREIKPIDNVYFMEFAEQFGYIIRESGNRIFACEEKK
jgi:hypothetical protein